jgi:hypothetical protein
MCLFKVCTQLWTAFFIFRSGLTVMGLAMVCCDELFQLEGTNPPRPHPTVGRYSPPLRASKETHFRRPQPSLDGGSSNPKSDNIDLLAELCHHTELRHRRHVLIGNPKGWRGGGTLPTASRSRRPDFSTGHRGFIHYLPVKHYDSRRPRPLIHTSFPITLPFDIHITYAVNEAPSNNPMNWQPALRH